MISTTIVPIHVTTYYERIDKICVRRYGTSHNDVVIFVMDQNPGLEKYGIVLPENIKIRLPDLPSSYQQGTFRKQVFLWS